MPSANIQPKVVTVGTKTTYQFDRSQVDFDAHNDSAFYVGIGFGVDPGSFDNCEYFLMPSGDGLQGIGPVSLPKYSIGGATWNGQVFVYTSAPPGGTAPSNAPASAVVINGWAAGKRRGTRSSVARLTNVGATSQVTTAQHLVDDTEAAGSQFIEASVLGNLFSSVSVTVDGKVVIKDNTGTVVFSFDLVSLLLSKGQIGVAADGDLVNISGSDTQWRARGGDNIFQSPGGTEVGRIINAGQYRHSLFGFSIASINGLTGTLTMYQPFGGTNFKLSIMILNGFRGTAAAQAISFPVAHAGPRTMVIAFGLPSTGVAFRSAGVAATLDIVSALGTNAVAGTSGSGTILRANSMAQIRGAFDDMQVQAADANTTTSVVIVLGF